jgi:hypothetical protein
MQNRLLPAIGSLCLGVFVFSLQVWRPSLCLPRWRLVRSRGKTPFAGFSDDIVIIVGSTLLASADVARSGIMELAIQNRDQKKSLAAMLRASITVRGEHWPRKVKI